MHHCIHFDENKYPILCEENDDFECVNEERLTPEEIKNQLKELVIELPKVQKQLKYFYDLASFMDDRKRWLEHTLDHIEKKDKIAIIFIVNGDDCVEYADPNEYLDDIRERVLKKTHNTGRPSREWQIRDSQGYLLPLDIKIKSLHINKSDQSQDRLFLSLKIGGC